MRVFHERPFPRPAPLSRSDEEECFTPSGTRRGVWLTTEAAPGTEVLAFEASEGRIAEYEVPSEDGGRTFVVPFAVLTDLADDSSVRPTIVSR